MVDQVSSVTGNSTASNDSLARLGEDFDKFLTLLTTQLKNQDPLDPVDTTEFTNQLVQFASVEQLIQQNKHMETLIETQEQDLAAAAVGYIGRTVEAPGSLSNFNNGAALWSYNLPETASSAFLQVVDLETGSVVRTIPGDTDPGLHRVLWDGTLEDGSTADEGVYQLIVRATDLEGEDMVPQVRGFGTVTNVELSNGKPQLVVFGNVVDLEDVGSVGL